MNEVVYRVKQKCLKNVINKNSEMLFELYAHNKSRINITYFWRARQENYPKTDNRKKLNEDKISNTAKKTWCKKFIFICSFILVYLITITKVNVKWNKKIWNGVFNKLLVASTAVYVLGVLKMFIKSLNFPWWLNFVKLGKGRMFHNFLIKVFSIKRHFHLH